ncbi:hypothetical protein GCM10022409_27330 [Hymenobacter glaciei]|uniref:Secretion system C-terminal sorting domain-containing protein n=1 Tax=Hymenobacter glaciei TaxID=877209 RepID=A0ABP7UEC9_9BACT
MPFAAQAQFNYAPGNATNLAGTYTDLGATGAAITTANNDDANSAAQPIGFTFTYNGTAFMQFVLSTNGFIKLGSTAPSGTDLFICNVQGCNNEDPVSSTNAANTNLILPFNFDLEPGTGTPEYRVATTGTAPNRICTIQWKNVSDKSDASPSNKQYTNFSFQVRLYETTNNIDFVYDAATPSTAAATSRFPNVGLKGNSNAAGQDVLVVKPTGAAAWSTAAFITGPYPSYTHNFRNAAPPSAGQTYRFVAAAAAPLTNDEPSGAITLPVAATCTPVNASNIGATTTVPAGYTNPGCGIAINPKDVWFKFTTAASGIGSTFVNIQTTGTAAGQIRVFSATSSAGPFTEAGCAAGPENNSSAGTLSLSSLTPGTTYYLFVSGYGSADAMGSFTICITGAATLAPPTFVTLPYSEGFEGPWATATSTRDVPTLNWRNNPTTGNSSWRREDDGFASANWSYVDEETGTTPPYPIASSTGTHSARFHTYGVPVGGPQGKLDLYVNLSGVGSKTMSFDYINPTGADKLDVLVSTNGGATFATAPVLTLNTAVAFTKSTVTIPGNSATTVIRFQATSDFGDDDLGIDNLQLRIVTATRNAELAAAVTVSPNPAHQRFTLSVPAGSLRAASATLSNALGQVVATRQLSLPATGGSADFDVSRLAAGIYTLTLQTGSDLVVKRVVVE